MNYHFVGNRRHGDKNINLQIYYFFVKSDSPHLTINIYYGKSIAMSPNRRLLK